MPRPASGYRNTAGLVIPGTHDITSRFANKAGLIQWAFKRGRDGCDLYDTGAVNIGTVTHQMAEMSLKGATIDEIDGYLDRTPMPAEDRAKVQICFRGFHRWQIGHPILPVLQEVPLISERHQYGGTPDLIGETTRGLALVDPKTSANGTPYPEMLIVMAAHGRLWLENYPDRPLTGGYHLLMLPKDGSPFRCYSYSQDQMEPYWQLFLGWREMYDLDKACSRKEALEGLSTPAAQPIRIAPDAAARGGRKRPQTAPQRLSYAPQAPMSMTEILRTYGHLRAN